MKKFRMGLFKVKRETKKVFILNRWAFGGGWGGNATFIYLLFLGVKIKTLHKYYFSYRKKYCNLIGVKLIKYK